MGSRTAAPPPHSRRAGGTSTLIMPTNINDLPGDLLELLLLHARSSVCLIRAAATCKLWRRVIAAAAGFLRRFRLLHPPGVVGHYYECRRRRPFFVPSPDSAINVRGRDSLDFLDHHYYYGGCSGGGRLQLSDGGSSSLLAFVKNYSTVVVCDPWTKQHRELTPYSPWKLSKRGRGYRSITIGAFFLLADDTGHVNNMSCFSLLCVSLVTKYGTKTAWATMYSARGDRWISLGSRDVSTIMPNGHYWFDACSKFLGRAGGSLCWSGDVSNGVLHLDESSGTFSTFTLPAAVRHDHRSSNHRKNLRLLGGGSGGDGSVLLARIIDDDLEVLRWSRDGGHECMVERKVCLSWLAGIDLIKVDWSWRFLDTAQTVTPGHLVLLPDEGSTWMFSINVETMVLTCLDKSDLQAHRVFPYQLPWPPTIKVCV